MEIGNKKAPGRTGAATFGADGQSADDSNHTTEQVFGQSPVRIPLLITIEMRRRLREAGLSEDEITYLTPTEAWEILGGLPEPGHYAEAKRYADGVLIGWLNDVTDDLLGDFLRDYKNVFVNALSDDERKAITQYIHAEIEKIPYDMRAEADSLFFGTVSPQHVPDQLGNLARAVGLDTSSNGHGNRSPSIQLDDYPPLPVGIMPTLARSNTWLTSYIELAKSMSPMTPTLFHESAGLWLISVIIARRFVLRMPFGAIYPNLFIFWLAPSTIYFKTTALTVARNMARRNFPHLLGPQDFTLEALLSDFAGKEPLGLTDMTRPTWETERNYAAQRGLVIDEFSGLMASSGKDYGGGVIEALLRLYDCDPQYVRSTRSQGRVEIRNGYLSILAASTPRAMREHLESERLWANGFFPRFALLTPDADPTWAIANGNADDFQVTSDLLYLLNRLKPATWPDPPTALSITMDAPAMQTWQAYAKALLHDVITPDLDDRLLAGYGRLPTQALKVASILAALDWPIDDNVPEITLAHIGQAMEICERWRRSLHRMLSISRETDLSRLKQAIVRIVSQEGSKGVTIRDMARATGRPMSTAEDAATELVADGTFICQKTQPGPQGGRPVYRYYFNPS